VPEGATLVCDLSQGPKGPQVAVVHEVDVSTASPSRPKGARPGGPPRDDRRDRYAPEPSGGGGDPQAGTVKFFDAARGFGFIARAQGGPDVFVHATALSRAGLAFPQTGQAVRFTTRPGKKGEEVAEIEFD
jgi:CspA family cold shock protein